MTWDAACRVFTRCGIWLAGVAEVDLDFVDFVDDLFGVVFDVGAEEFEVLGVVGFILGNVLFEVDQVDIDPGEHSHGVSVCSHCFRVEKIFLIAPKSPFCP